MAKSLQLSIPSGLNGTFKIKHKKQKQDKKGREEMKEKQRFICKTLKSIILKCIFKNFNLFFKSHLSIIKNEVCLMLGRKWLDLRTTCSHCYVLSSLPTDRNLSESKQQVFF